MAKIYIDADGCPVVKLTINIAKKHNIKTLILCDTSHEYNIEGVQTLVFSKGADSVDFALVNMLEKGDIVITQDYGLAAMCLAKNAIALNQNGVQYTSYNIDSMLMARHTAKKIRNSGGRLKGPSKRVKAQDDAFEKTLIQVLESLN
ncbi:MAG: YaiI/YqxD family protein [Clostridia bacterium]